MEEERIYPPEEPLLIPEPVKEEGEEEEEEDLSDLFGVSIKGYEREDVSDLFEVNEEDVMGEEDGEDDPFEGMEEEVTGEVEEPEPEEEKPKKEEPHWSDDEVRRYQESLRAPIVRKPVYRRTIKRYIPPDQISGTRGR